MGELAIHWSASRTRGIAACSRGGSRRGAGLSLACVAARDARREAGSTRSHRLSNRALRNAGARRLRGGVARPRCRSDLPAMLQAGGSDGAELLACFAAELVNWHAHADHLVRPGLIGSCPSAAAEGTIPIPCA